MKDYKVAKKKKQVGYRTPNQFRKNVSRENPALKTRPPRSLGGHN